jgi:polynucleotide 5'-kinase involved in rRNA processing
VNEHDALVERAVQSANTIALIGALDTGKSTLARRLLAQALAAGRTGALVDADVGQKTVGPPTTVTLKMVREPADLEPGRIEIPDQMHFAESTSPQGHLLPIVAGASRVVAKARELGADFVVVDSSGLVSGVQGQLLKYHKFEVIQPDMVVGLKRGEELAPLLGVVQRFFSSQVVVLNVHPDVVPVSVDERAARREQAMRDYFSEPLQRWRVKPTVFMPVLPPLFDLTQLDRVLVGLSDGEGAYLGLGYLERAEDEGVLRLVSPVAAAPKALRLGSVRLDEDLGARRVDLRNLLGTD